MNFDTAPIEEVEAWLMDRGMDAAIGCLPPGWDWQCSPHHWYARNIQNHKQEVEVDRVNSPRDELLRLAAKAWQAEESK